MIAVRATGMEFAMSMAITHVTRRLLRHPVEHADHSSEVSREVRLAQHLYLICRDHHDLDVKISQKDISSSSYVCSNHNLCFNVKFVAIKSTFAVFNES